MTLETIRTKTDKRNVSGFSAEKTAETIKDIAGNIREYSIIMRETTKTIRESGAIPELAAAIREAVSNARDTAQDIRQTVRELKQSGAIDDTARAVEETRMAAQDTIHTLRGPASIQHQIN